MDDQRHDLDALRREAEARLRERAAQAERLTDPREVARLLHELGVHQIELELQNEQLRQTQAELEAARDEYRDLYERAPVGYITAELDGTVLQANQRAAELLRTPLAALLRRPLAQRVMAASRPALQAALRRLPGAGGPSSIEVAVHDGNAGQRWVGIEMLPLRGQADGRRQCRLALLDIHERIVAREDQARLAAIVGSASDAIVGLDLAGRVTSWNTAAERLFGWSADEMQGRTLDALVPPERRDEDAELQRRVRRGEAPAGLETERHRRDGSRLQLAVTLAPVVDGQGRAIGSSLIAADIGPRKRAEQEQHRRLRQLDLLSQAGHVLIIGAKAPETVQAVQQRLFESLRQAVGADLCLQFALGPGGLAPEPAAASGDPEAVDAARRQPGAALGLCERALQRRSAVVSGDLQGSDLPAAAAMQAAGFGCGAAFPLIVQGEPDAVVVFASRSRQRFAGGDLQVIQTVCDQVAATLERHRLVARLHEREGRLEQADRAKDEFIATLAHELRNPLAPILNAVHILRAEPNADARVAWCRGVIERQVAQMARLLDDLLDVGRVSRNKVELRSRRIDLREAVHHAVETARPLLEARGHVLRLDLPSHAVTVCGDLTRLTQVFGNLLSNAAKYTDDGGRIRLALAEDGQHADVFVRDNGIGIDPPQLLHVFDLFAQLAPALERSHGGLGIGLALTKALVELHGGRVEAHSLGTGRGSSFHVRLPLAPAAGEAAPSPG